MREVIKNILLTENRVSDAMRNHPDIEKDIVEYASQKDPSGNNKYLDWILGHMISHEKLQDEWGITYSHEEYIKRTKNKIDEIVKILEKFEKYNDRLTGKRVYEAYLEAVGYIPHKVTIVVGEDGEKKVWSPKNINTYTGYNVLNKIIEYIISTHPTKAEIKKETVKLYEDGCILIVVPKSITSSCKYGAGTKWCTASRSGTYFKNYTKGDQGLVYYIFKKPFQSHGTHNQKMALHWEEYKGGKIRYNWFEAGDNKIHGQNFLANYLAECYGAIGDPDIPGVEGIPGYMIAKEKVKKINTIVSNYIKSREGKEIESGFLGWLKKIFN
jgi:hypothetical protein